MADASAEGVSAAVQATSGDMPDASEEPAAPTGVELVPQADDAAPAAVTASADGLRAIIRSSDMSPYLQQDAVNCAAFALSAYRTQKDVAQFMKKEFDSKYAPTWHVIVGLDFGSHVGFLAGNFIYFHLATKEAGDVGFLLWKSVHSGLLTDLTSQQPRVATADR